MRYDTLNRCVSTAAPLPPHRALSRLYFRERQLREEMRQTSLKFGAQKSIVIFLLKLSH